MFKKLIATALILIFLTSAGLGQESQEESQPLKVAVAEFLSSVPTDAPNPAVGQAAADSMINKFIESDDYTVVERSQIQKILTEQGLALAGLTEPQAAASVGELLGAEYIVVGHVSSATFTRSGSYTTVTVAASARVIEVETGRIVAAAEETGQSNSYYNWRGSFLPLDIEGARDAAKKLAYQLSEKLGYPILPEEYAFEPMPMHPPMPSHRPMPWREISADEWMIIAGVVIGVVVIFIVLENSGFIKISRTSGGGDETGPAAVPVFQMRW